VKLGAVAVPVAGKTGHHQRLQERRVLGFVPRATSSGFAWGDGFVVTAYVGYDDNRPMKRGGTRIMGSSGALPVWIADGAGAGAEAACSARRRPPEATELAVGAPYRLVPARSSDRARGRSPRRPDRARPDERRPSDSSGASCRCAPEETDVRSESAAAALPEVDPTEETDEDLKQVWLEEMDAPPDPRLHPVEVPDVLPDDEEPPPADGSGTG
jgi:membrane carboxypeptidase/penicillin-binding protein